MARPSLTLADRARGLLLGLASGHALGLGVRRAREMPSRRGWPIGEVLRVDTEDSPWGDDVALATRFTEELLEPEIDLRRLADRWIGWWRRDGRGIDPLTAEALEHIARHDAPVTVVAGGEARAPLARALPLAIPAARQPRNLVSGTYHTVFLTHPDPLSAWSAVALNVAAAAFARDRRDFLPDVLEVLVANDAPSDLLGRLRRVPFITREEAGADIPGSTAAGVELVLWAAYHEPSLERGLVWVANHPGAGPTTSAAAGGLLGCRDGDQAIPERWIGALPDPAYLRGLAKRLAAPREAAG